MTKRLFCFGMGYSASALAEALSSRGWTVAGTVTSDEKRDALKAKGYDVSVFSREHPLEDGALNGVTHIVNSIPPDEQGDIVATLVGEWLAATPSLEWAALLSTTGVYGNRDGEWVDEDSDLTPTSDRSARRVLAESQWLDLYREKGVPAEVFRLAGIYGPGRNPLDAIRGGKSRRIVKPGLVLGRIHRDDIVGVLLAAVEKPNPGAIYNVTDDEPVPPQDVVAFGCELLGVDPPAEEPFETAEMSPLGRSFYVDNKRVRNERIKADLGYVLRYPSYREGLTALLAEPARPPRTH